MAAKKKQDNEFQLKLDLFADFDDDGANDDAVEESVEEAPQSSADPLEHTTRILFSERTSEESKPDLDHVIETHTALGDEGEAGHVEQTPEEIHAISGLDEVTSEAEDHAEDEEDDHMDDLDDEDEELEADVGDGLIPMFEFDDGKEEEDEHPTSNAEQPTSKDRIESETEKGEEHPTSNIERPTSKDRNESGIESEQPTSNVERSTSKDRNESEVEKGDDHSRSKDSDDEKKVGIRAEDTRFSGDPDQLHDDSAVTEKMVIDRPEKKHPVEPVEDTEEPDGLSDLAAKASTLPDLEKKQLTVKPATDESLADEPVKKTLLTRKADVPAVDAPEDEKPAKILLAKRKEPENAAVGSEAVEYDDQRIIPRIATPTSKLKVTSRKILLGKRNIEGRTQEVFTREIEVAEADLKPDPAPAAPAAAEPDPVADLPKTLVSKVEPEAEPAREPDPAPVEEDVKEKETAAEAKPEPAPAVTRAVVVKSHGNQSVGAILTEARESLGFSLNQVAEATHIRTDYIGNIEEGNYQKMNLAPVYTKSYVKTLCRYYEVDSTTILDKLDSELKGQVDGDLPDVSGGIYMPAPDTDEESSYIKTKPRSSFGLLKVAVAIVVCLAILYAGSKALNMTSDGDADSEGPEQVETVASGDDSGVGDVLSHDDLLQFLPDESMKMSTLEIRLSASSE